MTDTPLDPYEGLVPADEVLAPTAIYANDFTLRAMAVVAADNLTPAGLLEITGIASGDDFRGRTVAAQLIIESGIMSNLIDALTACRDVIVAEDPEAAAENAVAMLPAQRNDAALSLINHLIDEHPDQFLPVMSLKDVRTLLATGILPI